MAAAKKKKKNARDATERNVRASNKKHQNFERRFRNLSARVLKVEQELATRIQEAVRMRGEISALRERVSKLDDPVSHEQSDAQERLALNDRKEISGG